jgi:hypothetical protein
MRNSSILGVFLALGLALSAHAQAPAGYLTLETNAVAPVGYLPIDSLELPTPAALLEKVQAPGVPVSTPDKETLTAVPAVTSEPLSPTQVSPLVPVSPVAPAQPPSKVLSSARDFESKIGASLRETLVAWSRKAGWSAVEWHLPAGLDFTLEIAGTYPGSYMEATRAFIDALGCETELRVIFNPTTKVTRIDPVPPPTLKIPVSY